MTQNKPIKHNASSYVSKRVYDGIKPIPDDIVKKEREAIQDAFDQMTPLEDNDARLQELDRKLRKYRGRSLRSILAETDPDMLKSIDERLEVIDRNRINYVYNRYNHHGMRRAMLTGVIIGCSCVGIVTLLTCLFLSG